VNLSHYDALSFDCYGTLIDWDQGIGSVLSSWAQEAGLAGARPTTSVRGAPRMGISEPGGLRRSVPYRRRTGRLSRTPKAGRQRGRNWACRSSGEVTGRSQTNPWQT